MDKKMNDCTYCGGTLTPGKTTFTVELGFGVVVIRHVPANLCDQCGEEWIDDAVAADVEKYVDKARRNQCQVEVIAFE